MKKLLFVLFAFITTNTFSQKWETIKGDGQVKKETRQIADFTSLSSQGAIDVEISYGNSTSVTVEADENLLPYIETSVANGRLTIQSKKNANLKSSSKMVVSISMTKINSLKLSGSGNINGKGDFTNDSNTEISISGSGNMDLDFDRFKDLDLSISGSGNMNLKGNDVNAINAKVSGSGNIDCSETRSNDVNAKISGSGNVKVYAQNSIDAKIAGSGNVFYKGDASKISSKVAGSGKVLKM
jgi:hypothetical protein